MKFFDAAARTLVVSVCADYGSSVISRLHIDVLERFHIVLHIFDHNAFVVRDFVEL